MKLVLLIVGVAAKELCSEITSTEGWKSLNFGSKAIDIAAKDGKMFIIKKINGLADWYTANSVAHFDTATNTWIDDSIQTVGARWDIAIDSTGNPAYISDNQAIYWKKEGKWSSMTSRLDCSRKIAFGIEGDLYKLGCALNSG
jgi:hypothetical protein